jgi:5-formyltetrahydrofolate cyclo-ligase
MTKDELRPVYLSKRIALTDIEYNTLNAQLCERFFNSINLSVIETLHVFLPIMAKREPNTWLIINRLQQEFKNIKIVIPKVNDSELVHVAYENRAQLKTNIWGIEEPMYGLEIEPLTIDLVIVPLLITDILGNRIGYGKGFYDRFLSQCRPDCKKIGLSFFEPVDKINDILPTDHKINECITPKSYFQY